MEWALNGQGGEAVSVLRHEVTAHLRRHAEPESDLAGAEIVVAELLANAFEHAPGRKAGGRLDPQRPRQSARDHRRPCDTRQLKEAS